MALSETATPLLAVIGPSASGKSTAVRRLAERGTITVHPTWTTRPKREDERHGSLEHRFVSDATFDALARRGCFLDSVELFGLPYRYGLPRFWRSPSGPVDTVMLRAPLVERFARVLTRPLVYQIEADPTVVAERLASRDSGADDVTARLLDNQRELVAGRAIADRVFVNDGTVDELADAIAAALTRDTARLEVVA